MNAYGGTVKVPPAALKSGPPPLPSVGCPLLSTCLLSVPASPWCPQGKFALCAYALCVPIPGSNPLVAECGCLEFDMINSGAVGTSAVLNQEVRSLDTKRLCQLC